MTKRLDLILNGKGGVGKSFFAVNFVQYLKDKDVQYIACDCDNENSTLKRFHDDVEFLDLAQPRALDTMFHSLEKTNSITLICAVRFKLCPPRSRLSCLSIMRPTALTSFSESPLN